MDRIREARNIMEANDLKLVVWKDGRTLARSKDRGIKPVYDVYKNSFKDLQGAFVADRVTGKAAAMLLTEGRISGLYSELISEPAARILEENSISYQYGKKVDYIMNRDQDGLCPIESISSKTDRVDELVEGIEKFFESVGMKK